MTDKKNVFRRALDSLVDGRQRSAQRYVDAYLKDHRIDAAQPADGR